jgi:hypothetical protein
MPIVTIEVNMIINAHIMIDANYDEKYLSDGRCQYASTDMAQMMKDT